MPARGAKKPRPSAVERPPGFPMFPQLPPEIRREVWLHARDAAAASEQAICDFQRAMADSEGAPEIICGPPVSLLLASREARGVMLEPGWRVRPFAPERDVLVANHDLCTTLMQQANGGGGGRHTGWLSLVRHVCLALPVHRSENHWLNHLSTSLPRLETVFIAFPGRDPTKILIERYEADIDFKSTLKSWPRLTQLSRSQLRGIEITSIWYYDYGGACPLVKNTDTMGAEQHLYKLRQRLIARGSMPNVEFIPCSVPRVRVVQIANRPKKGANKGAMKRNRASK